MSESITDDDHAVDDETPPPFWTWRVRLVVVAVALVALFAGGLIFGAFVDNSGRIADGIRTDSGPQMQQALQADVPGSVISIDSAQCVRSGISQNYTCAVRYSAHMQNFGAEQYVMTVVGSCDFQRSCEWHVDGQATQVG